MTSTPGSGAFSRLGRPWNSNLGDRPGTHGLRCLSSRVVSCDVQILMQPLVLPIGINNGNDRVSHRTMSISIREPSHGSQMWTLFRSQSTSIQTCRKYLIQSSCLLWRLVLELTRRQTRLFGIVSRMDQRSIVLDLHLNGLSAHAIHDDLVATLGCKALAYSPAIHYFTFVRLSSAAPKSLSTLNLVHLTSTIPTELFWQAWKKRHFRPCENVPEPAISYPLPSLEGSRNSSGSYDVFFAGCRTFCQMLRG
jgi:hypothetical protein